MCSGGSQVFRDHFQMKQLTYTRYTLTHSFYICKSSPNCELSFVNAKFPSKVQKFLYLRKPTLSVYHRPKLYNIKPYTAVLYTGWGFIVYIWSFLLCGFATQAKLNKMLYVCMLYNNIVVSLHFVLCNLTVQRGRCRRWSPL